MFDWIAASEKRNLQLRMVIKPKLRNKINELLQEMQLIWKGLVVFRACLVYTVNITFNSLNLGIYFESKNHDN